MTRYAIVGKNSEVITPINVYKDQRTFKNLAYAKKKLRELSEYLYDVNLEIAPVKPEPARCPHCKCEIGDIELEG